MADSAYLKCHQRQNSEKSKRIHDGTQSSQYPNLEIFTVWKLSCVWLALFQPVLFIVDRINDDSKRENFVSFPFLELPYVIRLNSHNIMSLKKCFFSDYAYNEIPNEASSFKQQKRRDLNLEGHECQRSQRNLLLSIQLTKLALKIFFIYLRVIYLIFLMGLTTLFYLQQFDKRQKLYKLK